jgi:D-serine deaminase-like pyridoxal phosphate-dependent protein
MSFVQDIKLARDYIGKDLITLPVPCFVLDRAKVRQNATRMIDKLAALGIGLRVHVETLKCTPAVREALGNGKHSNVIASTLEEIRHLITLVEEGVVKDVLYGVPVGKSHVKELLYLRNLYRNFGASLHLLVDHPGQLDLVLDGTTSLREKWSVFVKIDVGVQLAGSPIDSPESKLILSSILNDAKYSKFFDIHGFYSHASANHSLDGQYDAQSHFERELKGVLHAAENARSLFKGERRSLSPNIEIKARLSSSSPSILSSPPLSSASSPSPPQRFILSIGSIPASHDLCQQILNDPKNKLHTNDSLELHAGDFMSPDLLQVGSSLAERLEMAGTVMTEICSYYPARNEYLINAGGSALSHKSGPLPGIAHIYGNNEWIVSRVSQEYGIVSYVGDSTKVSKLPWKLGDRLRLYPQHACIASSGHKLYFITDGKDTVVDVWNPWRYW